MNTRRRFKALMSFQAVDRLPVIECFPYWDKTMERWHSEGLPALISEHVDMQNFFGLDNHHWWWMMPPRPQIPRTMGWHLNNDGIIANDKEYESLILPGLQDIVIDKPLLERFASDQASGDYFLWMMLDGFWWFPRELLGIERHLVAFYDQPSLIKRINEDLAIYNQKLLQEVFKIVVPDIICFGEDMSYNHGPMLSKAFFDEFIAPYYKQVVPTIKSHGALAFTDSDGNIDMLIPWLKEVGIMGISPLERLARNDIVALRRKHPEFLFIGGFDKTTMHRGIHAITEEFERLLPAMKQGGYIPAVDHQTPPEVSFNDYCLYVSMLKQFCAKVQ